jgi:plastocyanin
MHRARLRFAFRSAASRTSLRLLAVAVIAALLLVRGRTITIDCLSALDPATPAEAGMPPMAHTDWFRAHPVIPSRLLATAAITDSFSALGTSFQHASDPTVIDTAKIFAGDAIKWNWVTGTHTVTSGTGSSDPNAGTLFNGNLSSTAKSYTVTFADEGTYPFFCVFHEGFNMKGVVVVSQNPASVGPPPAVGEGFTRAPAPNPSRSAFAFQFAQSRPGHVRVTVLDAQGRRIATPLDGAVGAGTFESRWSGRDAGGSIAPAGVYFLRLELAGRTQTRRVTLVH